MNLVAIGAVTALVAVAAGAFGAHALREVLDPSRLAVFETAARYQLVHAVALVALAPLARAHPGHRRGAFALLAGIVLFSGSLYALALTGVRALGAVTPFGGLALLTGWAMVAWSAVRPGPVR
jgi:uncharacterized membrane protein YgdD (TMEM256/DUF423 family)